MTQDKLRDWLKLTDGPWPPNHYALIGLPVGTGSSEEIESRVLERLELLRSPAFHRLLIERSHRPPAPVRFSLTPEDMLSPRPYRVDLPPCRLRRPGPGPHRRSTCES